MIGRWAGGAALVAAVMSVLGVAVQVQGRPLGSWESSCSPPLFVFGASYMDVGENAAAMPFRELAEFGPYGIDYFGKPTGRNSNGRLIIDHLSQGLGQKFLSPYLRDVGATYKHGVNFASAGSTARNSSFQGDGSDSSGLFSLSVQVDQFRVFRQQTLAMYQLKSDAASRFPPPEDFSRGVYIIETGNNDYVYISGDQYYETMIASVLKQVEHNVRTLYREGARTLVLMDAFPRGCYPDQLWKATPGELDSDGCWIPAMKVIAQHNVEMRVLIANLSAELSGANLVMFSLHDVFMSAVRNPSKFGLKYVHKACCGFGGGDFNFNPLVWCGRSGVIDGELKTASVCDNRSEYMMWDGLHPTEAFAFHIAQAFLKGEHMQPAFHIQETCRLQYSNFL